MNITTETTREGARVLLISVVTPDFTDADRSLWELKELCENLGAECVGEITQKRNQLHPATCVGEGKLEEIARTAEAYEADTVVFDLELTPSQFSNIEDALPDGITLKDRTMIILDVFADRALSAEGKLQVELATLQYLLPRLKGSYESLSRIGGGLYERGAGESKLELDHRHIRRRIAILKERTNELAERRSYLRERRKKQEIPSVAICGYTNAGKSTLLNTLTESDVLAENKLFATLDPTTRLLKLPDNREVLLSDTVGFIRRLPHNLVNAFASTLEEVAQSDVVLVLCDASDPDVEAQLSVSLSLLEDLGCKGKVLVVYNKCDICDDPFSAQVGAVRISAKTGKGLDVLLKKLEFMFSENTTDVDLLIPYAKASDYYRLMQNEKILSEEATDIGHQVRARIENKSLHLYRQYFCISTEEGGIQ